MGKLSFYIIATGIVISAFLFMGINIALPIVGLIMVFLIMINYLKSHTISIEEHDYRKTVLSKQLVEKNVNNKNSKQTIPADPKVLALFQRSLEAKNDKKEHPLPIKLTAENKEEIPFNKNLQKQLTKEEQKEKVFVSISSQAKNKAQQAANAPQNKSTVAKDNIGKKNNYAASHPIATYNKHNSKAAVSQESIGNQLPKDLNVSIEEIRKYSKPAVNALKTIFDELIEQDRTNSATNKNISADNQNLAATDSATEIIDIDNEKIINPDYHNAINDPQPNDKAIEKQLSWKNHEKNHNDIKAYNGIQDDTNFSSNNVDEISDLGTNKNPHLDQLIEELPSYTQEIINEVTKLNNLEQYSAALKTITDFKENNKQLLSNIDSSELSYLESMTWLANDNPKKARQILLDYFSNNISANDVKFENKLNNVCKSFRNKNLQKFALPFFITLLSHKRKQRDFVAMNELYQDIENGYLQLDQIDKLIEAYQNHLAIKDTLEDYAGQLEILDRLGKLYYDQQNKVGVNFCYQRSLEIRKKQLKNK